MPMMLILLEPDVGSLLVYFAFSIVLFREGLPGAILLLGFVCVLLLFAALLYSKEILAAIIIGIAFVAFAIYTRKYKETLIGLLMFIACMLMFTGIFKLMHKPLDYYRLLASSFLVSGLAFIIFSFFKRIKNVTLFVLFFTCSIFFTYCVDYVFHHVLEQHQQQRMNILLGLEKDPLGGGYNVNQSMIAIGSGGFLGKGYLQGTQTKYNFVPEQSTDFIFCTVGEEWGFIGSLVVIGLFLFLLVRIVNMAERQRSTFSRVYAYCVASIIFFHFTINVGMAIGLLPVIGIPLPFFSYGGSSLWSFTILLFILVRLDASRLELL
jgi:rod shape determining protein RodA